MIVDNLEALLLGAVALGALTDIAVQIFLSRVADFKLLPSILIAFLVGGVLTDGMATSVMAEAHVAIWEGIALLVVVLTIYTSFGFCLFALINLGETSLRLRMLRHILTSAEPLSVQDVLAGYSDDILVSARFDRMVENRQIRVIDDRFYVRLSTLLVTARLLLLIKRLLYGKRPLAVARR